MQEFPPASELSHLIGDELAQVCLDPYQIQFRFQRNSIAAEFAVEQIEPDGTVWRYRCVAAEAGEAMLHRLIGKKIEAVKTEGLRMTISFDNGAALCVLSETRPYESGHIGGQGKFIVF